MGQELDVSSIIAKFDRLVEEGIVVYNDDYQTFTQSHNGLPFEFRILAGIGKKPLCTKSEITRSKSSSQQNTPTPTPSPSPPPPPRTCTPPPGLRLGSDIDVSGYEIANVGGIGTGTSQSHLLTFNKFPSARPHMLLVTRDGYRRQYEPLDQQDFEAVWQTLTAFSEGTGKRYLAFYNCGFDSGCSRVHKHMQVFPASSEEESGGGGFTLWPDDNVQDPGFVETKIPYKYAMARFPKGPSGEQLLVIYQGLLKQAEKILVDFTAKEDWRDDDDNNNDDDDEGAAIPHNVVLSSEWIVVIPRRRAQWRGAGGNAPSMMGMVWLPTKDKMDRWIELGPCEVLAALGVPTQR